MLWGIAQREGREAKLLTPEQAVAQMTTLDGYAVNAWANEPMITQPMAFCWDDRGRLWIAENRDYESRVFSNHGDSRILILEDTDHDGVADSRKVFLEGIPFPAASPSASAACSSARRPTCCSCRTATTTTRPTWPTSRCG